MWTDRARVLQDVTPGGWLGPRLTGPLGTVTGTVPAGYAAYARILHPVDRGSEEPGISWADVARVTGRRVHPLVQWHARIVLSSDADAATGWETVPPLYGPEEWSAPRLELPHRDHLLLTGPLDAVADIARYEPGAWPTQSPALFWPADRAWCVATEIDFDSTLVGGTAAAIAAVLASPDLEVLPVEPGDSLQSDADLVNR